MKRALKIALVGIGMFSSDERTANTHFARAAKRPNDLPDGIPMREPRRQRSNRSFSEVL